ncbi:MAG: transposase [Gemmatimonadetes bacterium]|nr:transposase [Gemmatimonadota bacterium]
MRRHEQLSLDRPWIEHRHASELAKMSQILDSHPDMAELIEQDLVRGVCHPERGARGMSGDQVLRALVLKQMNEFSYELLSYHLADSASYRTFCRLGALGSTPSRSALAENLKKVRPETLERIQRIVLRHAAESGVERGRKVRIDATVVEANIHAPTDSNLLWDGVRVLTRLLKRAGKRFGFGLWADHRRRAKRRMLAIENTGSKRKRGDAYRDLLKVSHKVVGYAQRAANYLCVQHLGDSEAQELASELTHYVELLLRVIDQTERTSLNTSIMEGSRPMSCGSAPVSATPDGSVVSRPRFLPPSVDSRSARTRRSVLRSWVRSRGLIRNSTAPSRMAAATVGRSSYAVIRITLGLRSRSLRTRRNSSPLMPGIRTSESTTSASLSLKASSAASPEAAVRTLRVSDSSASESTVRI